MLEIHFVELPKVVEYNKDDELTAWVMFLKAETEKELNEVAELNPTIKKAVEVVKVMSQDKKEREAYNAREKYLHDIATFKYEGKLEVAKNLLAINVDIETISTGTGLSKEEILKIKKEINP